MLESILPCLQTFPAFTNLHIPFDYSHRRYINLPPFEYVIHRGDRHDPSEHNNVPVHRLPVHRGCGREKAKNEKGYQEDQSYDINGQTGATEGPTGGRERLAPETFGKDAADGQNIRG